MAKLPKAQFRHVGVLAFDPDKLAEFYSRWFALVISDTGSGSADGARIVFMTGDPEEHHQVVFANLRKPGSPGMNQISFVYESLAELKELAMAFSKAGVPILQQKDHGNTWSVYVEDPEGNRIECYTPSPWHVRQPTWWPLDLLNESVEQVFERTQARASAQEGTMSRTSWMAGIQARIDALRDAA